MELWGLWFVLLGEAERAQRPYAQTWTQRCGCDDEDDGDDYDDNDDAEVKLYPIRSDVLFFTDTTHVLLL